MRQIRASVALLGGIVILFVGFLGMNQAANQAYDPAVINGSNESAIAYNMSVGVLDGVGQAAAPATVWMGIAAFILVSLGLLYMAVPGRAKR